MTTVLALQDVHKTYGATIAVRGVSLALAAGEVHAIVGENGAGKSSVALIAAGVMPPSSGQIEFQGGVTVFTSARDAESQGIVLIPQELLLRADKVIE